MAISYLALGSNLANPLRQITTAIDELVQLHDLTVLQASSLYQNPSLISGQPDYINAVIKISTALTPLELLEKCKFLEQTHQRVHYYHWGPRTLDIDILLYDNLVMQSEKLVIPHPQMHNREFVLIPLLEIAPQLILPNGEPLQQYLNQTHETIGLEKIIST